MSSVTYFAKLGNTGVYISSRKQMDEYLLKGANIYRNNGNQKTTLIATPEEGYLEQDPTLVETLDVSTTEKRIKNG